MTSEELYETLLTIQKMRCETQTLELKSAEYGIYMVQDGVVVFRTIIMFGIQRIVN